jgi:glycerol 3-phosphatase-2
VINDLTDLYRPYPTVEHDGDGRYRCGGASADVQGTTVRITGNPADLDSWRAACAAWWAAKPEAPVAQAPGLEWLDH